MRNTCTVENCDRLRHGRGYCSRHYTRWQRHGDPLGGGIERPVGISLRDLFDSRWALNADTGCWDWQAGSSGNGYGRIHRKYAHRVGYQLYVGEIPKGMVLDHLCERKCCVNPAHLEPIPQGMNLARAIISKYEDEILRYIKRKREVMNRSAP